MNLVNAVEEVKEKLSSKEYKDILDSAMKIHNASSSNNIDVHAEIHGVYVDALHKIMDAVGGFDMISYRNVSRPYRTPLVVAYMVNEIKELNVHKDVHFSKKNWYESCVRGYVDTYDIEKLIKEAEIDDTHDKALFYIYVYRFEEIPEKYEHRISKLYEWDFDDEDPDWDYYGFNDWDDTTTIDELWDMMYTCREQHYLTYDFLEAISVY